MNVRFLISDFDFYFSLSYRNGMSLKMYLICFNIEKKTFLANNDNGNWMSQTQFETLKTALHSNDENVWSNLLIFFLYQIPTKLQCFLLFNVF